MIKELFDFKNKVIVVTGCSGHLGRAIVNFFIANNAKVYGLDIKKTKSSKNFTFLKCDLKNEKNCNSVIEYIYKQNKKINVFINNAAVSYFTFFEKRKLQELNETISVNLFAPFYFIKALQKKSKKSHKLKIINISSIYGNISPDFNIYSKGDRFNSEIYGASKAGLQQMTKYFANLLASKNININCISPGGIKNYKVQKKTFIKKYLNKVPSKRLCETQDILTAIAMFSSNYSNYITGQNLIIDGGLSLK